MDPQAPMSRKKISTTIYVTPEQSERLRLLHERTKVPVAVYIREGIDLVLRQYDHLLPGQLPLAAPHGEVEPRSSLEQAPAGADGTPAPAEAWMKPADVPSPPPPVVEVKPERAAGVGKG
jgi:ribbon-helix-helix protein